jgi:hypothetical protein
MIKILEFVVFAITFSLLPGVVLTHGGSARTAMAMHSPTTSRERQASRERQVPPSRPFNHVWILLVYIVTGKGRYAPSK